MTATTKTRLQFIVTADVEATGELNPVILTKFLAAGAAMSLTELGESASVENIVVQCAPTVPEAVLIVLGDHVEHSPAALDAVKREIATILADFNPAREKFLTEGERSLLIKGIALASATDEMNEPGFIHSTIECGHRRLLDAADLLLVEMAFVPDNCLLAYEDKDFLKAVTLLAEKPQILEFIQRCDRHAIDNLSDTLAFFIKEASPAQKEKALPLIETVITELESLAPDGAAEEPSAVAPGM